MSSTSAPVNATHLPLERREARWPSFLDRLARGPCHQSWSFCCAQPLGQQFVQDDQQQWRGPCAVRWRKS